VAARRVRVVSLFSFFSLELCFTARHNLHCFVRHSAWSATARLIARCCCNFSTFTCLKFCSVAGVAWATVLAAAMLTAYSGHAVQWCVTSKTTWSLRASCQWTLTVDVSCMTFVQWTVRWLLTSLNACISRGGVCVSAHQRRSLFQWLCMEQFTIVCHVIVVAVDFQAPFEDVLVRNILLVTLILFLIVFCLPNTSTLSVIMLRVL